MRQNVPMRAFQDWIWAAFAVVAALCLLLASSAHARAEADACCTMAGLKAQTAEDYRQTHEARGRGIRGALSR